MAHAVFMGDDSAQPFKALQSQMGDTIQSITPVTGVLKCAAKIAFFHRIVSAVGQSKNIRHSPHAYKRIEQADR